MFIRTWLYAVAFGISLTASTQAWGQSAAENQPEEHETTADTEQEGHDQQETPTDYLAAFEGIESAIRDLIAEEDKIAEQSQRDREQRDLNAQESMANWAELMFYATGATVLLTALALWAIIRTLHHTRKAAESADGMLREAEKTTSEAVKQTELAERSFNTLETPYLAVTSIDKTMLHNGPVGGRHITYNISNFGRSPAVIVAIRHHLGRQDMAGPHREFYEVIAPGGELNNMQHVPLDLEGGKPLEKHETVILKVQISFLYAEGVRAEVAWNFVKEGSGLFTLLRYG